MLTSDELKEIRNSILNPAPTYLQVERQQAQDTLEASVQELRKAGQNFLNAQGSLGVFIGDYEKDLANKNSDLRKELTWKHNSGIYSQEMDGILDAIQTNYTNLQSFEKRLGETGTALGQLADKLENGNTLSKDDMSLLNNIKNLQNNYADLAKSLNDTAPEIANFNPKIVDHQYFGRGNHKDTIIQEPSIAGIPTTMFKQAKQALDTSHKALETLNSIDAQTASQKLTQSCFNR